MIQQQLYEWITHPERLNRDTLYELRTLLARYPYFQTVRLLYLKNLFLLHDITFGEELRKAALYMFADTSGALHTDDPAQGKLDLDAPVKVTFPAAADVDAGVPAKVAKRA